MKNRLPLLAVICVQVFWAGCHADQDKKLSSTTIASSIIPPEVQSQLENLAKEKRFDEGLRLLRPYAEKGNPDAQFGMAMGIVQKGGEVNNREVVDWMRKAASQGQQEALGLLSESYRWGNFNLPTNQVMAEMWKNALTDTNQIKACLRFEKTLAAGDH
ncbi:MAG: hypothetical protein WCK57_11110 [Verrucomicrobiae bacterium]